MKFFKDEAGYFKAEEAGDLALFADFLQSDIQGDKKVGVELLELLEKKSGEHTGNAYICRFDDKKVEIEGLYGDETCLRLDRHHFFQGVEAWIMFISE